MIIVLHGVGGLNDYNITTKNDHVISTRPLFCVLRVMNRSTGCSKKVEKRMMLEPKNPNQN